jgi:hypothetical protein
MFQPEGFVPALARRRKKLMPAVNPTPEGKKLAHPAERAPRIFADTAKIDEIRILRDSGIINGVTTNPTLLKRAGATSWGPGQGDHDRDSAPARPDARQLGTD